jgi:hydroxymethylbilane synthase
VPGRTLIVGTRGSRLAREQARRVTERLPGDSRVQVIKTSGDRFKDQKLGEQSGVGFFTKEIEQELLSKKIDLAVHSLKDLPTAIPSGLVLAAVLQRDEAGDVLLVRPEALDQKRDLPLKAQATLGASSMRRQALLAAFAGDVQPVPIRGNVPTRVEKCIRGECDAVVLARAGLARLGLEVDPLLAFDLNPRVWICAPGQGVIAVEARQDDQEALERLSSLEHAPTRACVDAERSLHVVFGGGCHAPFGAYAELKNSKIHVAAPSKAGRMGVKEFSALDAAEEWIRSGCPSEPTSGREEWICRPARSWC